MCQVHLSYNGARQTREKSVCLKVCVFLKDIGATVLTGRLFELDVLTPRLLNGFLKWL